MSLDLDPRRKKELATELRAWIAEEWDFETGELQAGILLEFIAERLKPVIYVTALAEAQAAVQEALLDLEARLDPPA
jgi:uncharacterized protein (DUF2164 family)